MLTQEQNDRLTRVGLGTPCGELMRRYWHPIWITAKLPEHGAQLVRLLGEDLVLFRDRSGRLGLVGEKCAHRLGSMVYGIPEDDGLRCAYHGWLYDATGRCLEQPYEQFADPESTFKDKVKIKAYPVEELGGLIFAYLGPEPTPLLPRWDLLVKDGIYREIGYSMLPCNWLQVAENGPDTAHTSSLHGRFARYTLEKLGRSDLQRTGAGRVERITTYERGDFPYNRYGSWQFVGGEWVSSGGAFPLIGKLPDNSFQTRVPVDDTHTFYLYYFTYTPEEMRDELGLDWPPQEDPRDIPVFDVPVPDSRNVDWGIMDSNSGQDLGIIVSEGDLMNRTQEHLGLSDQGVIMYRQVLEEQISIVEDGGDPINVFRDPAENQYLRLPGLQRPPGSPWFGLRNESGVDRTYAARKYSPILRAAAVKEQGEAILEEPIHS